MKKRKKKLKKSASRPPGTKKRYLIFGIVAVLVILYVGYLLNLNRYKSVFERFLEHTVNADVTIASISLNVFGDVGIKLNDVTIHDTEAQHCFLHADQILFDIRLIDIISHKIVHFSSINIIKPHIKLCKDEHGDWHIIGLNQSTPDTTQDDTRKDAAPTAWLPRLPLPKFEYSSFYIDTLQASSGTVEILNVARDEIVTLKRVSLNCWRKNGEKSLDFLTKAQVEHDPKSMIHCEGTIQNFNPQLSSLPLPLILTTSKIDARISLDAISALDLTPLLSADKSLPESLKDPLIYGSCTITGGYRSGFSLHGRLHPTKVRRYNNLLLDFSMDVNMLKQFIEVNSFIAHIDATTILGDGTYDLASNTGILFAQTDRVTLTELRGVLPFLRKLDLAGNGQLFAKLPLHNFRFTPALESTIYLEQFTGKFKVLQYPIQLQQPCIGTITANAVTFERASVLYHTSPLLLDFRYVIEPEPQIVINFDNFSDVQLLDIIAMEQPAKEQSDALRQTDPSQNEQSGQKPEPAHPQPKQEQAQHVPLYISGPVTNARFGKAFIEYCFLDTIIEYGRILLKDINLSLYGGSIRGNGIVKRAGSNPSFSIVADIRNIHIEDIISDVTDYTDLIKGDFSAAVSFQCTGRDTASIKETLRSHGVIKILDGTIYNLPLLHEIMENFTDKGEDKRIRLYGSTIGLRLPPLEEFGFEKETSFRELRCDYEIKPNEHGKNAFHANNLSIESPKMNIRLKGYFDFEQQLNFEGVTHLSQIQTHKLLSKVKELAMLFNISNDAMEIPFMIKGTLTDPQPVPIIRLNTLQNKMEDVLRNKLFKSSSEDIDIKDSDIDKIKDKLENTEIDEDDMQRIKKFEKRIKKFLE